MTDFPLDLYRIFREISRTGNLTRAAENLFMSQPNVSIALKSLENHMGTSLCTRTKKGIILTREGKILADELEHAFLHIDTAQRMVKKLVHLESGEISISASDTICNYFLLPYIAEFTRAYPKIRLGLTNRTSSETASLVALGHVDFGFLNLPYTDDRLAFSSCCPINEILITGSRFLNLAENGLNAKNINDFPLILLEQKSNSRLLVDDFFNTCGITLSPLLELGSLDLIISFVKANMGIAFIPKQLCGQFIDNQSLWEIPLDSPLPQRSLGLVEAKGQTLSCAAAAFKNMVLSGN